MKAIGLFSGGLDSILAVKLMKDQGIEVEVVHYDIGVEPLRLQRRAKKREERVTEEESAAQLGVTIRHIDVTQEFLSILFAPKHGYGSGMNPCIDCKIFIMRKAKEYMERCGAKFVFTGEVVGQRPMSQYRQTMEQTERESGLQGYLLRPLSARLLDPTVPEQEGWVDRERLLGISGRGRTEQQELAQNYKLSYPQPAGGCLLTDAYFARRLQELMTYTPPEQIRPEDMVLLKLGRHFRFPGGLKVIVGRHEADNNLLEQHLQGRWSAEVRDYAGPLVLILGEPTAEQFEQIAQLLVSYTKAKANAQATVDFFREGTQKSLDIVPDGSLDFSPRHVE